MSEATIAADFSTLVVSIGSSALMAMGLAPHPGTEKTEKDRHMAQFNIDLLLMLKAKTKNNLSNDEGHFLDSIISDLQMKFVQMN